MDIEFPTFKIFLILIPFTLLLLQLSSRSSTNKKSDSKLPPTPWKLPLIGNIHHLIGGPFHIVLRDLAKKYGPLMHLKLGEVSVIVISSAETAKEVMKTHDINFSSRSSTIALKILNYNCSDLVFSPHGEYWKQVRKICVQEFLSAKRVQSFYSLREEEFSNLVSYINSNAGNVINLTEMVMSTTYSILARAAFGKKSEDHETFISLLNESNRLVEDFNIADFYPSMRFLEYTNGIKSKLERLKLQQGRILDRIIEEHRRMRKSSASFEEKKCENLVDVLMKYQEDETEFSLTTDNIKAILLDIFGAGGQPSSTTVDWAMCEMLKNPNVLKKAQDEVRWIFNSKGYVDEANFHELKYMKAVIKETLRLHPPAVIFPRECREACEIKGYKIPKKTRVIVNLWAIGRDPIYWQDSECFKPERFLNNSIDYKGMNFEYIPFGTGRRICPGMLFGLANVELPLVKFLYHFEWTLPNGMKNEELNMTETFGATATRIDDLYVIPSVYSP